MYHTALDPAPLRNAVKNYRGDYFRHDLFAAICVALLALPQAIAYAFVADLPASAGIWSVVFGTIFTASLGQSRILISGITNTLAIIIQSGTSEILSTYYEGAVGEQRELLALNIVLQLVFFMGIFQIAASLLKLGRLTQFASRSVIVGYMAAAALTIVITQLFPFLGIAERSDYHPLYEQGWYILTHLTAVHGPTLIVGAGSLVLLTLLYMTTEKIPAATLVLIIVTTAVAFLKFPGIHLLKDAIPFESVMPVLKFPWFDMRILGSVIPLAFALALMSVMEATAIGRFYTSSKEPFYHDNQEIYGLGIGNLCMTVLGGMPCSGSFSRSALNYASGAKTRLAAIFSGIFVLLFFTTLSGVMGKIPIAALSALMMITAYTMVNFRELSLCLSATRGDAFVVISTIIASLFFTLDKVLYIGIALSIALYLKQAGVPLLIEYTFNNLGKLRPVTEEEGRLDPRICIFQAEGELFFGAAEPLQTKLREVAEDENIKVIILQLLNIRYLDASVCLALEKVYHYLHSTGRRLILAGIAPEVWQVLAETRLLQLIGPENCFPAQELLPGEATREAYAYAKTLI